MQVNLNGDDDYRGGRLVFATAQGFMVPKRPAGSATIHTNKTPHGVSTMLRGVRYGLFLCDTKSDRPTISSSTQISTTLPLLMEHFKCFQYLVDTAIQYLDVYGTFVRFLNDTPDAELYTYQREYFKVLNDFNHSRVLSLSEGASVPERPEFSTLAGEMFWHVHTLHPQIFNASATSSTTNTDGLDLVIACKKNTSFMRQVIEIRKSAEGGSYNLKHLLGSALERYVEFLMSLGKKTRQLSEDRTPVPSLLVDLMWHTHMSFPQKYAADCLRLCGRQIDHVVDNNEE